jgi:hypothetical protein
MSASLTVLLPLAFLAFIPMVRFVVAIAASGSAPPTLPTPLYTGPGRGRADFPAPLFPFNGCIQATALYHVVLNDPTIETHLMNGNGIRKTS